MIAFMRAGAARVARRVRLQLDAGRPRRLPRRRAGGGAWRVVLNTDEQRWGGSGAAMGRGRREPSGARLRAVAAPVAAAVGRAAAGDGESGAVQASGPDGALSGVDCRPPAHDRPDSVPRHPVPGTKDPEM